MILEGALSEVAVGKVVKESGIAFESLWSILPSKYK